MVEFIGVFAVQLFDFVFPADYWNAIGVVHIKRGKALFGKQRPWIVFGARIPLFHNDIAFGDDVFFGQHKTPHLDQLEGGKWPSFVTGLKRLRERRYGESRDRTDVHKDAGGKNGGRCV